MSKERTLANIAQTAYWIVSENQDTFDRVAKAVEKEVLARLNKSEAETQKKIDSGEYSVVESFDVE